MTQNQLIAKVEALENAAAMIAGHMETNAGDIGDIPTRVYITASKNLAQELNNRANRLREKHGYNPNKYNYK